MVTKRITHCPDCGLELSGDNLRIITVMAKRGIFHRYQCRACYYKRLFRHRESRNERLEREDAEALAEIREWFEQNVEGYRHTYSRTDPVRDIHPDAVRVRSQEARSRDVGPDVRSNHGRR